MGLKLPTDVEAKVLAAAEPSTRRPRPWREVPVPPPKAKPTKYRNKPFRDRAGVYWHSRKEYRHWLVLRAAEAAGLIRGLRRQVRYRLTVNGVEVGSYVADFTFFDAETDRVVVQDVKSPATRRLPLYRLKRNLMRAVWGLAVEEV
jgi:hypothetical protein